MNFAPAISPLPSDRRTAPRTRVTCSAKLRTSIAIKSGELWDLSVAGARFIADSPPGAGVSALLEWEQFEAMCRVVWSTETMCGVQFDKPLPRSVIDQCVVAPDRPEVVATIGNIQMGRRRSLLSRAESGEDEA